MLKKHILKVFSKGTGFLKTLIKRIEENFVLDFEEFDLDNENLYQISEPEKVLPKAIIEEEVCFDLQPVRDFMDEYVGMVITDYQAYQDDLDKIDNIAGTILTAVKFDSHKIYMTLSSVAGRPKGVVALSPTLTGQFAERNSYEEPVGSSRFRIEFFGGLSIEYLDAPKKGCATFHEFHREINDFA